MSENKYKDGDTVYANEFPGVKLRVRRYVDTIYYCHLAADLSSRDLVYFERELSGTQTKEKV